MPKATRPARVACAMQPKPRNPTVRVGEEAVVLSWGPQNVTDSDVPLGHEWEIDMFCRVVGDI
jgi:hypothetical protein